VKANACGPQAGRLQQGLAHQVRQPAAHVTDTEIDAGLAKMDRLQLRVAVGHVQERHVAERRDVVQASLCGGRVGVGVAAQAHAGGRCRAQHLNELALVHKRDCTRTRAPFEVATD
jgi:hypothetical protein